MNTQTLRLGAALTLALALCSTAADGASPEEGCAVFARLAETIAKSHQSEVPMQQLLDGTNRTIPGADLRAIIQKVIVTIYDGPRFQTEENQQQFIHEWRDRAHVDCLNNG